MRTVRLGIATLGLALGLAGCGGGQSAAIEAGQTVYNTGGASQIPCSTCHTLDGTPLVGPSFQGIAERAATRVEGQSAEQYLRQSITQPSAYLADGSSDTMPKIYGETLSEEDIDNLIAFLMSLE